MHCTSFKILKLYSHPEKSDLVVKHVGCCSISMQYVFLSQKLQFMQIVSKFNICEWNETNSNVTAIQIFSLSIKLHVVLLSEKLKFRLKGVKWGTIQISKKFQKDFYRWPGHWVNFSLQNQLGVLFNTSSIVQHFTLNEMSVIFMIKSLWAQQMVLVHCP